MFRRYIPRLIVKTVTAAATPEFLADGPPVKLFGVSFRGMKAAGTENVGDVTIQVGGADAIVIPPGGERVWPQPPYMAGYFLSTDFKIKVANDGDGVVAIYSEPSQ